MDKMPAKKKVPKTLRIKTPVPKKKMSISSFISKVDGESAQLVKDMSSKNTGYTADEGDGKFARRMKENMRSKIKSQFGTLYRKQTGKGMKLPKGKSVKALSILSLIKINLLQGNVPLEKVESLYNKYVMEMRK